MSSSSDGSLGSQSVTQGEHSCKTLQSNAHSNISELKKELFSYSEIVDSCCTF